MTIGVSQLARSPHPCRGRRSIVHWLLIAWFALFANATLQVCCHAQSLTGTDTGSAHTHAVGEDAHAHDHHVPADTCDFISALDITTPSVLLGALGVVAAKVFLTRPEFLVSSSTNNSPRFSGAPPPGALTHPLQVFGRIRI